MDVAGLKDDDQKFRECVPARLADDDEDGNDDMVQVAVDLDLKEEVTVMKPSGSLEVRGSKRNRELDIQR